MQLRSSTKLSLPGPALVVAVLAFLALPTRADPVQDPSAADGLCASAMECATKGRALVHALSLPHDTTQGLLYLDRACTLGLGQVCGELAYLYSGTAPSFAGLKDMPRAVSYAERGCEANVPQLCVLAGDAFDRALDVPLDKKRAARLFQRACERGQARGCHSLGILHAEGSIGPKDDAKAAALYIQACEMDATVACDDAGNRLVEAWGIAKDEARGMRLLRRGCEARSTRACLVFAHQLDKRDFERNRDEVRRLYEMTCDAGESRACLLLVSRLKAGSYGPPDPAQIRRLYGRAEQLLEAGCAANIGRECERLSQMLARGESGKRDPVRAQALLKKACTLDPRSCPKPTTP